MPEKVHSRITGPHSFNDYSATTAFRHDSSGEMSFKISHSKSMIPEQGDASASRDGNFLAFLSFRTRRFQSPVPFSFLSLLSAMSCQFLLLRQWIMDYWILFPPPLPDRWGLRTFIDDCDPLPISPFNSPFPSIFDQILKILVIILQNLKLVTEKVQKHYIALTRFLRLEIAVLSIASKCQWMLGSHDWMFDRIQT